MVLFIVGVFSGILSQAFPRHSLKLSNGMTHFDSDQHPLSRTHDLVLQIKQITVKIHDIKNRKKENQINSKLDNGTFSVHNHIGNGPLQEGHVKHDEDDVCYEDSVQSVHPVLDNKNSQEHCVLTQCPSLTTPTALPSLPPELHPSSPNSGIPEGTPSRKLRWSKLPNVPESPGIVEGNAVEKGDPPWSNTKPSWSGTGDNIDEPCKKAGE